MTSLLEMNNEDSTELLEMQVNGQEELSSILPANEQEAAKLGKTQGSHGCIRLSVPDAQWMEKNLPVGTKIEIVG